MSVRCSACGQEWPRDPALEVVCPTCHAAVGMRCCRPGGYKGNFTGLHASRDQAAMDAGLLQKCPAASSKPMKRKIPQFEFRIPNEPFALVGERQREQTTTEEQHDKKETEDTQTLDLFERIAEGAAGPNDR